MTHQSNTDNPIDFPEEPFDIVLYTLQEKIDLFWSITKSNMNTDLFNIMDEIRLEQIDELRKAMELWKNSKQVK
jgi:hypothetical protein